MISHATLFISDLHLSTDRPDLTDCFLRFLQHQAANCQALYILGDLFDMWLGDDLLEPYHQTIINALAHTSKTTPIYFMHGNRDFLIDKEFANACNMTLLPEPSVIDLYGKPTLLLHGDSLCVDDKAHLRFRRITRNRILRKVYFKLPVAWRRTLAHKIRQKSIANNRRAGIRPLTASEIPRIMQQYHVSQLIHGHTHIPGIHLFKLENQWVCRHILSDWGPKGHYLAANLQGQLQHNYML